MNKTFGILVLALFALNGARHIAGFPAARDSGMVAAQQQESHETAESKPTPEGDFGEEALRLLTTSTWASANVMTQSLAARCTDEELQRAQGVLCGYVVKRRARHLSEAELDELKTLVLTRDNFQRGGYRCGYVPEYAFTCHSSGDSVTVMILDCYVSLCGTGTGFEAVPTTSEAQGLFRDFATRVLYGEDSGQR
jgi:hypothetical protein